MSDEHLVRRTLADKRRGRTDWARIDAMTEEEIEANALSDPDNPPWTEEQLAAAELVMPGQGEKVPISIRLDDEVLDFFRRQGPGYQSRINAVLLGYVRERRRKSPQ
jgi:uncharacterized protein (DUF4415 family)